MALLLLFYVGKYSSYRAMSEKNYLLEKQLSEIQNNPILSKATKQELSRFLKLHFFKKQLQ